MSSTDSNSPPFEVKPRPTTKKLPTFRASFQKQLDALRAYAVLSEGGSKPVHYSRVAPIIKVHESNTSSMNPFFLENGFIEKSGNAYLPTSAVLEYNRQYGWNNETAARALQPIVANSWFGVALSNHLYFNAMAEDDAIAMLAKECSAGPEHKPQLRMLIDYYESAGLAARANGQIAPTPEARPHQPAPAAAVAAVTTPRVAADDEIYAPSIQHTAPKKDGINFQISVDVSMAEMADWPPDRIAAFFAGIAQALSAKNG